MKIKINTEDLIGELTNFPIEIIEKMLEYQYKQNNIIDISVFINFPRAEKYQNGFNWKETPEGFNFWDSVIREKRFDVFFKRYAKSKEIYIRGDVNNGEDTTQPVILKNIIFSNKNYIDKVELCLGKNYEIVVEGDKTFVQRKKIKYPTTYEECCQYLGCNDKINAGKLILFQQLINARNAYWKIAGEEMGLGKSWKFENPAKRYVFTIEYSGGKIILNAATSSMFNRILVFPTEEMRDAFYENFKELIEKCKELL